MRIMNSERRISQILDIELMPTTGGEVLICYQIVEDGVKFSFTHGLYGRVFDFEDGTSIVQTEDAKIVTLHPDNSLTVADVDSVEDVSKIFENESVNYFNSIIKKALRGTEDY